MRYTIFAVLVLALAAVLAACSPLVLLNAVVPRDGYARTTDLPYGPLARQQLDVYAPATPVEKAPRPVVIFFYGGGWESGDRTDYRFVAQALASQNHRRGTGLRRLPASALSPVHRRRCQGTALGKKQYRAVRRRSQSPVRYGSFRRRAHSSDADLGSNIFARGRHVADYAARDDWACRPLRFPAAAQRDATNDIRFGRRAMALTADQLCRWLKPANAANDRQRRHYRESGKYRTS